MRHLLLPVLVLPVLAGCTSGTQTAEPKMTDQMAMPAQGEMAMPGQGGMAMPGQGGMAMPSTKGSLKVISPSNGATITAADIPVRVAVSNFRLSPAHVGMPDVDGEGHIHVMLDGMNMGVLYNFYTAPAFTLPGRAMEPGQHTLIFDLASNTHEDFANTVQKVNIDYEPARAERAPAPVNAGVPAVQIVSPANGATVGPRFTMQVQPANFTPALDLEGKPNIKGYGHYHVFVDTDMSMGMSSMSMSGEAMPKSGEKMPMSGEAMPMSEGMMSMAGMVSMPGSNSFPVDLSAWKNGKHTIAIEPVQNDHTPIEGAKPATITVNLEGAGQY